MAGSDINIALYEPQHCPCKRRRCSRHGDCTACREHHAEKNALTACERAKAKAEKREAKQNRSAR